MNFNDTGAADTTFNGMAGTAFEMNNWPAPQPFDGAIVQLTFGSPNFFETSFANRNTGVTMQQIPTPGALALLGLGGLAIARRRRA